MFVGVSIKQRYGGHAMQTGHVASQCQIGAYTGTCIIVVDNDIDVSNVDERLWALCTRSDLASSIDIIKTAWLTPLDPRIPREKRERGDFTNSRANIDAGRPFHWRHKFQKVNMPGKAVQRETRERFGWILDNWRKGE